jgi:Tol biopolymer transport system component
MGGRQPIFAIRAYALALVLTALAAGTLTSGADAAVSLAPSPGQPPTIAYVIETASSPAAIWTVRADGSQTTRVGAGSSPVIAPSGQQVAASLFGIGIGVETGPALAIYSTVGAAPLEYLSLAGETATPLAWSPDGRYLAVDVQSTAIKNTAKLSGLAIVDLQAGTLTVIAHGQLYGASFAPNGSDELVYGLSPAQTLSAPVNVYRSKPDGTSTVALTRDGRSLFPVWGPGAIAYDRERLRRNDAPVYQIWLRSPTSSKTRRLTNIDVRTLVSGLVPLAFSADGSRLLAQFEGQDTSEAWTVRLPSGRARRLTVRGRSVQAAGLSSDGKTVLVDEGGFDGPASEGRVATMPFSGGLSKLLVAHGSQSSWNG